MASGFYSCCNRDGRDINIIYLDSQSALQSAREEIGIEKEGNKILNEQNQQLHKRNLEWGAEISKLKAEKARMVEAIKDILDECPRSVDEATVAKGNGSLYERIVRHPEQVVWNFSISEMRLKKLRETITISAKPEKREKCNSRAETLAEVEKIIKRRLRHWQWQERKHEKFAAGMYKDLSLDYLMTRTDEAKQILSAIEKLKEGG